MVFNNLKIEGYGSTGSLSFESREAVWVSRGTSSSSRRAVAYDKMGAVTWSLFGKFGLLSIYERNGDMVMRLDGFRRSDREKLADAFSAHDLDLQEREYCSEATHHGRYSIDGSSLVLGRDGKQVLELDLRNVSQCVIPQQGPGAAKEPKEVTMQFVETDAGDADEHQLVEMRLWVPTNQDDEEGEIEVPAAVWLHQQVSKIAKVDKGTSDQLAEFPEATFLVPRGRYSVEMYGNFFRMHGNMYDFKIGYADVEKFYLLPRNDDITYVFILCLAKPIRQGQQRYPFLVWQLKMTEGSVDVNGAENYPGLSPTVTGAFYQIVARVFKTFSGKKIYSTGKFESIDERKCISCSYKAKGGYLYPLERSFVFIHQPTLVLRFEDIASVEFERFSNKDSATRNFDMRITMKSVDRTEEHYFSSFERAEYKPLLSFLSEKNLKLVTTDESDERQNLQEILDEENDDSEDDEEEEEDGDFKPSKKEEEEAESEEDEDDEDEEDDEAPAKATPKIVEKSSPTSKKKKREEKKQAPPSKKKRKKDPNAPKGKSSPYIFFSTAKRNEIKAENPDLSTTDISRELGKLWKTMTDEEKEPYNIQAKADAERYDAEMAKYKASGKGAADDDDDDVEEIDSD